MKTKQLQVKTNVRTGAVRCTHDAYSHLQCYVGRQIKGVSEPQRVSVNMPVGKCLDTFNYVPSDDYACYVA